MKVLIGLPVYKRAWIIPQWLKAIESQTFPLEDLGFIFELGPDDDETHELLLEWHDNHPEIKVFDGIINLDERHSTHPEGQRSWDRGKYSTMSILRNSLLDRACEINPDRYFSLDSDILLEDPTTIQTLVRLTEKYEVVSPLMYMTPYNTDYPSVMSWHDYPGGKARRIRENYQIGRLFQADIVMAAVMMTPDVFKNTRYFPHMQGEDLGFAAALHKNGFQSWCASHIYCPHIMFEKHLEQYLKAGDKRNPNLINF